MCYEKINIKSPTKKEMLCKSMFRMKGLDNQLNMLIEECSELILAISKYKRGFDCFEEILKESADVDIVLSQLKLEYKPFYELRNIKLLKFENYVIQEQHRYNYKPQSDIEVYVKTNQREDYIKMYVNSEMQWSYSGSDVVVKDNNILYWSYI